MLSAPLKVVYSEVKDLHDFVDFKQVENIQIVAKSMGYINKLPYLNSWIHHPWDDSQILSDRKLCHYLA